MTATPQISKNPYYPTWSFALFGPCALGYSVLSHLYFYCCVPRHEEKLTAKEPKASRPVVLITGCNTGIGVAAARTLILDHACEVIFACRSESSARAAMQQIEQEQSATSQGLAVFVAPLDLSSFASVRSFVQRLQQVYQGRTIDVLVNNAGRNTGGPSLHDKIVTLSTNQKEEDAAPTVEHAQEEPLCVLFQTNFLGHYLLTAELLRTGLLSATSPDTRIVNLSSVMHHFVGNDISSISQLQSFAFWYNEVAPHATKPYSTYNLSKLAAILFTVELRKRYPHLQAIAVNPGAV
jgi:WW domain-containing oxidoreductase